MRRAGLQRGVTVGSEVVAVNGCAMTPRASRMRSRNAKASPVSIQLLIKRGDQYRTMAVKYHGGLRYSQLERIPSTPALLDDVLSPR
jgi:hypothetical protein